MNEADQRPPAESEKAFICEICGPDKPANKVFECTVCNKDFCVAHLGTWVHNCYENE